MITSQMPVSTWHDVVGEPTFADAILDRIVHNAYRIVRIPRKMGSHSTPRAVWPTVAWSQA